MQLKKSVKQINRTRNVTATTTKAGYLKGDADIDGRIILMWILEEQGVKGMQLTYDTVQGQTSVNTSKEMIFKSFIREVTFLTA
jgi:hypothetical protein